MKKVCLNLVLTAVSLSVTTGSVLAAPYGGFHGQTLKGLSNAIDEANQMLRAREQADKDFVKERIRFMESLKFQVDSRIVNAPGKIILAERPSDRAIACAKKQAENVYKAMSTIPGVLDKSFEANLQTVLIYTFEVLNPGLKGSPLPDGFSAGEALAFRDGTSHLLLPVGVKANGSCVLQNAQAVAKALMNMRAPEPESPSDAENAH